MTEHAIEINDKSFGITFGVGENHVISEGISNSVAHRLELNKGDQLSSINNISIDKIKHNIFHDQDLPFNAECKNPCEFISDTNNPEYSSSCTNNEITERISIGSDSTFSPSRCPSASIISDDVSNTETPEQLLINQHIIQNACINEEVYFDQMSITATKACKLNKRMCFISSNGFITGCHEWSFQILKCDVYWQEIGVVSNKQIDHVKVNKKGIKGTRRFFARATYGNELGTASVYYASYNNNGTVRCYKDLSKKYKIGWCTGDVITVCLDLNEWKIKFYINGAMVRKVMSVQKGNTYYPVLAFSGNCQYRLVD